MRHMLSSTNDKMDRVYRNASTAYRGEYQDMALVSPQSFGDLLRRYRLAAGLTQEELAARTGLSARGLSDLERGARRAPRQETLQLLSQALHLSAAELALLKAAARRKVHTSGVSASLPHKAPTLPLVGRAQELMQLDQLLTGGPPVLLVAGEPGIGKSRLLQEGIERAKRQGWTVLPGGCHRRSGQDPYSPLVDVLADSLHSQPSSQQRHLLQGCHWLVRLLPELADSDILSQPARTLPLEQGPCRLMFAAVARYLDNIAGPAGTLLVLDDLHWAGSDAFDLLQSLIRVPMERPLRILGAYRDTDIGLQGALTHFAADLTRDGRASRIMLSPLIEAEVTALLTELLPQTQGWEPHLRQKVMERAGGVPLFLVSCV